MKLIHFALMALLCVCLWSCSNSNDKAVIVDSTGKHPDLWAVASSGGSHPAFYISTADKCSECHGADLKGGVSAVSCFSASRSGINCHPAGPSGHPEGFAGPGLHGVNAKSAAVGSLGMAFCKNCHGADYRGAGSSKKDCIGCHKLTNPTTNAPHSPAPWRGGARTHVTVDPGNAAVCAECHLNGANSAVKPSPAAPVGTAPDCFNNTLCHGVTGHANESQPWSAAANHGARGKINLGACQSCHATPSSGVNPRFNVAKANLANGCESCHKLNTAHPTPWLIGRLGTPGNVANTTSHATAGSLPTACALCHGTALNGALGGGTAPSCMSATTIGGISCHATTPAANPTGCKSCHAVYPPVSNKHAVHLSLAGVTCAACHSNLGPGTATHANGTLNVALSSTYQAKTGGALVLNPVAKNCANVSCHGGQNTPPWTTGTINVNADCKNCHVLGATQYNSYNSGEHDFHVNSAGRGCTECHNITELAKSHFSRLDTQVMEGPASATVGGGATGIPAYVSRSCTPIDTLPGGACHFDPAKPQTRTW